MEVEINGRRVPMGAGKRGWWRVDAPDAKAGDDYAFVLDENNPLPDPRSRWQPNGVHAPSRLVDESTFQWTDAGWQAALFVPMLFQGEEWGAKTPFLFFTDFPDPDLSRAVSEGRKNDFAAFGWDEEVPDPQVEATFRRSKLDWAELEQPEHRDLLERTRKLIELHKQLPQVTLGNGQAAQARFDEQKSWFCYEHGPVRVVCNLLTRASILT